MDNYFIRRLFEQTVKVNTGYTAERVFYILGILIDYRTKIKFLAPKEEFGEGYFDRREICSTVILLDCYLNE